MHGSTDPGRFSSDPEATIAAIASAAGRAARGIVRISGPQALACVAPLWCGSPSDLQASRRRARATSGKLDLPGLGQVPCLLYVWPDQRSYTRQPTVEVHTVGTPVILDVVLQAVCQQGARLARPGEFTLRSFLAGRLDLMQAEAVLAVIDADSPAALQDALRQLAGGVSQPLQQIRSDLIDLRADLEAGLDFVDEDIAFVTPEQVVRRLDAARDVVQAIRNQLQQRTTLSDLPQVVLWGPPNAGKSSLFNALCRDDVAMVSPVAGTTRDYVSRLVQRGGQTIELVDTAGVESDSHDPPTDPSIDLAQAAQQMTHQVVDRSRLRLVCVDRHAPHTTWQWLSWPTLAQRHDVMVVYTKCDGDEDPPQDPAGIATSSRTGRGIESLWEAIEQHLARDQRGSCSLAPTSARCATALDAAAISLHAALQLAQQTMGDELVAAELGLVLEHLADVVGAVYTNDLLDRIFSRFCIGK